MRPKTMACSFVLACIFFLSSGLITSTAIAQPAFELDGNAYDDSGPGIPDDWSDVVTGSGSPIYEFIADPSPATIFGGSVQDTEDISAWIWLNGSVPLKQDITNAVFALYEPGLFYFGMDRSGNSGDVELGVWLLQDAISLDGAGTFNGAHVVGDLLVLMSFPLAGPATIVPRIYEWDPGNPSAVDNLVEITGLTADETYAVINTSAECSPWDFTPTFPEECPAECSDGDCFPPASFIEGKVNLDALADTRCFQTYLMTTRATPTVSAYLKDFVLTPIMGISPEVAMADVCEGDNLCVIASGASGSYSYSWSTGDSTSCLFNPAPGTYTVTVTDNVTLCSETASGTVLAAPTVQVDNVCAGGTLCASISGGTAPYSVVWSTGATTTCIFSLTPGAYWATVTDANGCTGTDTGVVLDRFICPQLCVEFTAVATLVSDPAGLLTPLSVGVGDTVTGEYVYDPLTVDTNALPTVGDYWHSNPAFGISVNVAGTLFQTNPASVSFLLEVVNDLGTPIRDNYLVKSYNNLPLSSGTTVEEISWQLDDDSATAISGDAIPTSPPNLADWQSLFGLTIRGENPANPSENYTLQFMVFQDAYCGTTVGVGPENSEPPGRVSLLPAYPNPFVTRTRIAFTLIEESPVTLNLYGVNGRLVRSLHQGNLTAGAWSFPWNGQDNLGRRVPAGIYLVHLVAGDQSQSSRIIRID